MATDIQQEIAELKNRIRIMENDKKAYQDESDQMLKRQANMIEKLKEENKNYCKDMVSNSKKKKEMGEIKGNIATTQSEIKLIKDKIDKEMNK
jgi:predicted Zn-dependent protease